MNEVKRYWFCCSWDGGGAGEPEECDDGGYVSYEDYESLLKSFEDQNKIIAGYRSFAKDVLSTN